MNASKDQNNVNTLTGVLDNDGATVIRVLSDPSTNALRVSDGTSGTNRGPTVAIHDGNNVPTLAAVSYLDGKTVIPIYVDSNGNLLVQSS